MCSSVFDAIDPGSNPPSGKLFFSLFKYHIISQRHLFSIKIKEIIEKLKIKYQLGRTGADQSVRVSVRGGPNPVRNTPHHTINEWHILDIIICLFWCIWQIVIIFFLFFFFGLSVAQITHVSTYAWLYYHHSQPFSFFFFFFLIKYIYYLFIFFLFFYLFFIFFLY